MIHVDWKEYLPNAQPLMACNKPTRLEERVASQFQYPFKQDTYIDYHLEKDNYIHMN